MTQHSSIDDLIQQTKDAAITLEQLSARLSNKLKETEKNHAYCKEVFEDAKVFIEKHKRNAREADFIIHRVETYVSRTDGFTLQLKASVEEMKSTIQHSKEKNAEVMTAIEKANLRHEVAERMILEAEKQRALVTEMLEWLVADKDTQQLLDRYK